MKLPLVGLGTYKLQGDTCKRVIRQAYDLGYRHIDTADFYQNHKEVGQAIKELPRNEVLLATKIFENDLLPERVEKAVPRFLEELQVDYVDLLLIHWPNPQVNLAETLEAMLAFKEKGQVKEVGVSNFVRSHLEQVKGLPILTNQIELQPYLQRRNLVANCRELGIQITSYRSLARGEFENDETMRAIAKKYGKSPSQIALKWIIQNGISIIPKASSVEHLKANIDLFDFMLTPEDKRQIDALDSNKTFTSYGGTFED